MTDTPQLLLAHHLKSLRLPTFLREYDKVAKQCAAEGIDHSRYLLRLAELELIDRERRMVERRIKAAKFPAVKSLDSFDFKAMPSLNKMLVMELARCDYISRNENIIAVGNSGTGKTHIGLGLGLADGQGYRLAHTCLSRPASVVEPVGMYPRAARSRSLGRRPAGEGGMGSFGIVEVNPLADDPFGLEAICQFMQVDRLVFERPP